MSPRPYNLGRRQAETEQTRLRILQAALDLLAATTDVSAFTIDAVAKQAGVARMTVYYQFESKPGLLEALFDFLARRGGIEELPTVFQRPDPLDALDGLIGAFGRFWFTDRLVIRRLNGLAAFDQEIGPAHRARQERRRMGLRVLLGRLSERYGHPAPEQLDDAIATLHALTSFESFDLLAGDSRSLEETVTMVRHAARRLLGMPEKGAATEKSLPQKE